MYEEQFKLTWLDPAPMNDTQALATTKANADKYGLKTLSDLAAKADELTLACPPSSRTATRTACPALKRSLWRLRFQEMSTS